MKCMENVLRNYGVSVDENELALAERTYNLDIM